MELVVLHQKPGIRRRRRRRKKGPSEKKKKKKKIREKAGTRKGRPGCAYVPSLSAAFLLSDYNNDARIIC